MEQYEELIQDHIQTHKLAYPKNIPELIAFRDIYHLMKFEGYDIKVSAYEMFILLKVDPDRIKKVLNRYKLTAKQQEDYQMIRKACDTQIKSIIAVLI